MAVLPRLNVCQDSNAETLTITDVTGLYDASTNTGGWGTPNDAVTDITAATLAVTEPDGTITTFNLLTDSNATWPSANLVYFDVITLQKDEDGTLISGDSNSDIGTFSDGTYSFTYTLTGPSGTVYQVVEFYCHRTSTACVQGMFADLEVSDCSCDTDAVRNAILAFGYHQALRSAVECNKSGRITDIQAALDKICNNTNNCSTC